MEHIIDAKNQKLGRVATRAATFLQGKNKADFESYKPGTDKVIIKNSKLIEVSGRKADDKIYYHHTGFPGGLKKRTYKEIFSKNHKEVIQKAVFGMLPSNKLRSDRMKRLIIKD
ncbi:MAG: 50S ribosomal protein L13 [Candidatus Liptonbacteria bacterium CG11_big_fil_rev_8_21_14_0_20_35_14]|uniref:Large ribosomal subunit protein uL13 n=1 Tax=Candidatus Liptonbacteria bacterium CG11_big_fil_rev_8_21_14_0_20_35_14 TaxID=1974634 RepID=A0A2H0N7E7_9BACT|nr:MAG: 50S ribosomal protein L13 [Candidatus Liptonbacteria bacterium CG11_big_fil_rev_8_21_14_0_20_35_14]